MLADELGPWMDNRGWTLPGQSLDHLETLVGLWLRYGAVMNLTGARTRSELLPQLLDGLDTAWVVRENVGDSAEIRWLDLGSGGGFPGLVVAAVGQWTLMLLEPRQKRASFLELALRSIGRGSIGVQRARFERSTWGQEAASGHVSAVEPHLRVTSARAVWTPETWLEVGSHVVGVGGHVVFHLSATESPENFGVDASVKSERGTVAIATVAANDETR